MMLGLEREQKRGSDMGGNMNLRHKNVRSGWRVRSGKLIKEIEVQIEEMRNKNNEKEVKYKWKLASQLAASELNVSCFWVFLDFFCALCTIPFLFCFICLDFLLILYSHVALVIFYGIFVCFKIAFIYIFFSSLMCVQSFVFILFNVALLQSANVARYPVWFYLACFIFSAI